MIRHAGSPLLNVHALQSTSHVVFQRIRKRCGEDDLDEFMALYL